VAGLGLLPNQMLLAERFALRDRLQHLFLCLDQSGSCTWWITVEMYTVWRNKLPALL